MGETISSVRQSIPQSPRARTPQGMGTGPLDASGKPYPFHDKCEWDDPYDEWELDSDDPFSSEHDSDDEGIKEAIEQLPFTRMDIS